MKRLLPVVLAATALLDAACAADLLQSEALTCTGDQDCPMGHLCLVGSCVDPAAQNLSTVDILVAPLPSTGLKPQAVLGIDARARSRHDLTLRPTLDVNVRTCFDCAMPVPGSLPGTLQLTSPFNIRGQQQVETAIVDGVTLSRMNLLEFTTYDPVLFPEDPTLPLLRGAPVYAASNTVLEVSVPSPARTWVLSGRVVENDAITASVPVEGLKVWVSQGDTRLVRDVLTGEDGRFSLRVLTETASALVLHVAPAVASDPYPEVAVMGVNLDADRDLGDVSLDLAQAPTEVTGRVLGDDGAGVAGAAVSFEGTAGAGVLHLTTVTDADGNYTARLPASTYTRAVVPPRSSDAALKQEANIGVAAGDAAVLDVSLGRKPEVCGTVRHQGSPVARTRVRAIRVGNTDHQPGPASTAEFDERAVADDSGRYCMHLQPGAHLVTAQPPDGSAAPQKTDLVMLAGVNAEHNFDLPRAALVVGTLVDAQMQPVAQARVRAFSPVVHTPLGALEYGETYTAPDGTFTLTVPDFAPVTTP